MSAERTSRDVDSSVEVAKPGALEGHRCGYVAIVGRPNVGKSTLLNRLVGQKLSITARKPQTTRHRILGIRGGDGWQIVYVDTPGIHRGRRKALNRYMNRAASSAIEGVDAVVQVVEAPHWTPDDEHVRAQLRAAGCPLVLAPNKVDRLADKTRLLPYLERLGRLEGFDEVVPISARRGDNVERLQDLLIDKLPPGPPMFSDEQVTDRTQRFLVAEIVREKLTRRLGQEVPYQLTVEIERFETCEGVIQISAIVWVERKGHKRIVIGKQGAILREVGREARLDMQKLLDARVHLHLWVKVREGWSDDERALRHFGYDV